MAKDSGEKNKLNDLTGSEWIQLTKSYWISKRCKADKAAYNHPAPFLIKDIEKLIKMFTKKGMTVVDPFVGSGTTILSAIRTGRVAIGIDINQEYKKLLIDRIHELGYNSKDLFEETSKKRYEYIIGDAEKKLNELDKIDYIVTSPPYHNILKNKGNGIRKESSKTKQIDVQQSQLSIGGNNENKERPKIKKGYRTAPRTAVEYYTDDPKDLGNKETYAEFIEKLKNIMSIGFEKLKDEKYCSIIISDFTVDKKERCVQADIVEMMQDIGFEFCGTTVLLQNSKPLYPFGYPFKYKINHHHQNIINFIKKRNE